MDEIIGVSSITRAAAFDQVMQSSVSKPPPLVESIDRNGSQAIAYNNENQVHLEPDLAMSSGSFSSQEQNMEIMYPVMTSMNKHGFNSETTCEHCGVIISNNHDAIVSHMQQCCNEIKNFTSKNRKIEKGYISKNPGKPDGANFKFIDEQLYQVEWDRYIRKLQNKMAADYNFATKSFTFDVPGLEIGMKLESLDRNNPQSFCVATVVEVKGHRVRIRYDGYGRDDSNDLWCNFQADELYPIGWCAQNAFPLQPPTGINCTLEDWRKFLTKTLTGALAAPKHLFPLEHYQPKVHSFENGMKLEIIHPTMPYIICPATVVKSLGPYYFLIATDTCDNIPSVTMCCHSDSSNIFPAGWSYRNGIELSVPSGYTKQSFTWDKYLATCRTVRAPQHLFKKSKQHKFRAGQKLEAVDLEHPDIVRVATITNVMGRVLQLFFDGQTRFQFVECDSPDIHGFGWCKRTGHPLVSPYGPMPFKTVSKYEGCESHPKLLKLISFDDVIVMKPARPNVANHDRVDTLSRPPLSTPHRASQSTSPSLESTTYPSVSYSTTPYKPAATDGNPRICSPSMTYSPSFYHESTPSSPTYSPPLSYSSLPSTVPSMLASSVLDENYFVEDGNPELRKYEMISSVSESTNGDKDKCSTLSPSDDDEDLSDEDGSGTGSERFYHNKNQIYFNKSCCCGPLLNPEDVKQLPNATEPGKVSTVIRTGLEMVAKCANDPEQVLDMMQEGTGVRLSIKHNGKTYKKAISRVDSRPKLERYLKRFCRRLVCCEYFLSLIPISSPCPDDCKADQFGYLQGPKGMKAKRAREYFQAKRLGHEKKKRGRRPRNAATNEVAAQRAAAGIVTSVFPKGDHVPLPNLNLPVTALADHLRNTATKILHQVQANQVMLHSKTATSSTVTQSQTTADTSSSSTNISMSQPAQTFANTIKSENSNSTWLTTTTTVTTHIPTYGKPRILPSPYGPPPLPRLSISETIGNKGSSYRSGRPPNQQPKKIERAIMPAVAVPYMEIHIPQSSKLPLSSKSTVIAPTTITYSSENMTTTSAKPVFQLTPTGLKTGRLVAVPCTIATDIKTMTNNCSQTTSLVTTNKRPIPASTSHTQPPPLIPTREKSVTSGGKSLQVLRPSYIEGKLVAAAPNVCVTERGTFVATQLNKSTAPTSGACVVNHVVGQSADANVMMNRMFSVVRNSENGCSGTVPYRSNTQPQVAHVHPSVRNRNNSVGNNSNSNNTHVPDNTNNVKTSSYTSTEMRTKREAGNTPLEGHMTKFSLNVGGGMGAVTTAVRSGMLAREKYRGPIVSRDPNEETSEGRNYKIRDNIRETFSRSALANISERMTNRVVINPNISEHITNQRIGEITPTASPTFSEITPIISEEDEQKTGKPNDPVGNRDSTSWAYQKIPKKKVRFTAAETKNSAAEVITQQNGGLKREEIERGVKREYERVDSNPAFLQSSRMNDKEEKGLGHLPSYNVHEMTSSKMIKGVLHAVQSSQHPSVKLRPSSSSVKQFHAYSGFPGQTKRQRILPTDPKKSRSNFVAKSSAHPKANTPRSKTLCVNASTNTSFPGCSSDSCLYHPDNPRRWSVEEVGEYISSTDCKNYAAYFMDQEIDGESFLMLTRSTLMQFTNMKLGPTLKLSNYIAQLRARVGMSKST